MKLQLEIATPDEWHVLKGQTQYGPYSYAEVINMMQNKIVFGFDYAWSPHLETWTALSELPEFSAERLNRIAEKTKDTEVFLKRKHKRAQVQLPIYAHNNQQLWKGNIESLSEGGALLLLETPTLLPGDMILIHFKKTDTGEAFNCQAEVLSKKLSKQKLQHNSNIHYAVKFLEPSSTGVKQIKEYVKKGAE